MAVTWAIRDVIVEGRAILAPLSGVTDVAFRRIARRYGAALVVSEMVAADELVSGSEEARLRAEGEGVLPHVVQLAGRDPHWMGKAAKIAENSGATIIDINMGCPAKRVTGGYSGSALMRDMELATAIIEATVSACQIPVTVKMRLGWDDASLNAPELAMRAEKIGAAAITVHGRTRQQFYKGSADWRAIRQTAEAVSIPVIANGDIGSAQQARDCLEKSNAQAVMIGRAALGRPWIVGQIGADLDKTLAPVPSPAERADIALEHYQTLLHLYGKRVGIKHSRKHLAAYIDVAFEDGFTVSNEDRLELVTSENPDRVCALLKKIFSEPGLAKDLAQ